MAGGSGTQGQTNLRNLIFKLRQLWPGSAELLDFDRKALAWKAGVKIDADVVSFQRAVDAGLAGSGLPARDGRWNMPFRSDLKITARTGD